MVNIDQTPKKGRHRLNKRSLPLLVMFASEHEPWFDVYRAAMLELDSEKLPERIVAARKAVQWRLKDIQGDPDHHAEREEIEYALNNLRILEREK